MTKKPAKKTPAKKAAAEKATKKLPSSTQALAQEMLRMLTQRLGPEELIMPQDVDALLASLAGPLIGDHLSDEEADAKTEAQQIAFDAMEATSAAAARKLAKRALRLDPDCVDALLVMNDLDARTTQAMIAGLQNAVSAGERALGAKFIAENTGHFWMLLETRPYMRALEQLGSLLFAQGLHLDAIRTYEKMLELNPNDNQGVRDPLLGAYLCIDDLKGASKLLKTYKDDAGASFAWGRVLERFLSGDQAGARTALKQARQANRFVELFMTGQKPIPEEQPEMYSMGSEEEAVLCMDAVGRAWALHKDAVFWLLDEQKTTSKRPGAQGAALSKETLKRIPVKGKRVQ